MSAEDDYHLDRIYGVDRRRDSRQQAARAYGVEIVNRGRRATDAAKLTNTDEEEAVMRRLRGVDVSGPATRLREADVKAFPLTGAQAITGIYEASDFDDRPTPLFVRMRMRMASLWARFDAWAR